MGTKNPPCCGSALNALKGLPLKHDLFLTLPARDWLRRLLCSLCVHGCELQELQELPNENDAVQTVQMIYDAPNRSVFLLTRRHLQ